MEQLTLFRKISLYRKGTDVGILRWQGQGNCCTRYKDIFEAGKTGSWTQIDTGRTSAGKYTHFRYNLGGTEFIVWADGANNATKYDGTTVTDLNATGAPAIPSL